MCRACFCSLCPFKLTGVSVIHICFCSGFTGELCIEVAKMIEENTVALIVSISRKLQILEISCFPLKSFLILGPSTGFHMAFSTIVFCNFVKCIDTFPSIYESITDRALLF